MECHNQRAVRRGRRRTVVGRPTTIAARLSSSLNPDLPTLTNDTGDPVAASLVGSALRASAHGISCLAVERGGRWHSAVEPLMNTSGDELTDLLLSPCHLAVRTRRDIDDQP